MKSLFKLLRHFFCHQFHAVWVHFESKFFIFNMQTHGMRDYFIIIMVERNIFYALCKATIFLAFNWGEFYCFLKKKKIESSKSFDKFLREQRNESLNSLCNGLLKSVWIFALSFTEKSKSILFLASFMSKNVTFLSPMVWTLEEHSSSFYS